MAESKKNNLMSLPKEVRQTLEGLEDEFEKTLNALDTLERLGMDVTSLKDQLKTSKAQRDIMLKEFA